MKISSYSGVYALTLLISAALLFSIQPMFSKMILPLLGGTPQVWNTAMLFFQMTLLAGYAYAHGTTRLMGVRAQAVLHVVLLLVFVAVLPFGIAEGTIMPENDNPTFWQLALMASVIGGPFFVLSGSAPMFQRWFSETDHPDSDNPYFLYGASNLGSMTSLLAYPVLIEPYLTLDQQALSWMYGYILLIVMAIISAAMVWKHVKAKPVEHDAMINIEGVSWKQRGWWLLMAFLPSSLMLGVTTYITTDIASAPLLWILPLSIYVGTFILVFARKPLLSKKQITEGFSFSLVLVLTFMVAWGNLHASLLILTHLAVFFFAAMLCHTELAESRPNSKHLTEFYLIMSLGGALGGILNALIAPQFFIIPLEYTAILLVIIFLRYYGVEGQDIKTRYTETMKSLKKDGIDYLLSAKVIGFFGALVLVIALSQVLGKTSSPVAVVLLLFAMTAFFKTRWMFNIVCLVTLLLFPPGFFWNMSRGQDILLMDRNFFGVMRVIDMEKKERAFIHGTTNHGTQPLIEGLRMVPLSYYSGFSPIRDAYTILDGRASPQKIGVIGLGVGVTACFTKPGRSYDFFEIDPDVVSIAENTDYFTYLSDCGSPYEVKLGDGRLKMLEEQDDQYDMILLDAYSSDNIPVHLITIEALRMYMEKLKEDGILIFNVSNRHLDLEPVLTLAANEMGIPVVGKATDGGEIDDTGLFAFPAQYVIISRSAKNVETLKDRFGWTNGYTRKGLRLWTDDYSNIFSVLDNRSGLDRVKKFKEQKKNNKADKNNGESPE